jgi:hypothetical protein
MNDNELKSAVERLGKFRKNSFISMVWPKGGNQIGQISAAQMDWGTGISHQEAIPLLASLEIQRLQLQESLAQGSAGKATPGAIQAEVDKLVEAGRQAGFAPPKPEPDPVRHIYNWGRQTIASAMSLRAADLSKDIEPAAAQQAMTLATEKARQFWEEAVKVYGEPTDVAKLSAINMTFTRNVMDWAEKHRAGEA